MTMMTKALDALKSAGGIRGSVLGNREIRRIGFGG